MLDQNTINKLIGEHEKCLENHRMRILDLAKNVGEQEIPADIAAVRLDIIDSSYLAETALVEFKRKCVQQ